MAEKSLNMNSREGGALQVDISASARSRLASDTDCSSCIVWTASAGVYVTIGENADATKFLLPANVILPIPVDNLNLISAYNSGASSAKIYVLWRSR